MNHHKPDPIQILLVEDNPGDVDLMLEVFGEMTVPTRISVAVDGEAAMSFLHSDEGPRPDIVLLDLNLPKKHGREVLSEIKADPSLMLIPVIIVSSSEAEHDLREAYRLHANCFVTKAVELEEFFATIRAVANFWLNTAKLPPRLAS